MRRRWARWLAAAAIAAAGCYEVPPAIPPGYIGSPAAPGWPPLAVYDTDAFHPRNRWFHRAFSGRGADGQLHPVHADLPVPALESLTVVDRAELTALLARILEPGAGTAAAAAPAGDPRADVTGLLFRSDALAAAALLATSRGSAGDWSEVIARLVQAATADAPAPELLQAPMLKPPPLRDGSWDEIAPPAGAAVEPGPTDPRWSRRLRERAGSTTVLLRLRVALGPRREPLLLDLASECWRLDAGASSPQLWLFDRAEWLQGRDPWREVPAGGAPHERERHVAAALREAGGATADAASQAERVRAALGSISL